MNTPGLHSFICRTLAAIAFLASLAIAAGCQKRCQQPAQTTFQHLRDTPWRLVETNKGDVKKVVNHDQFDAPILTFDYNISPDDKELVLRYSAAGGGDQTQASATSAGTISYQYKLTNELTLVDSKRGYFYRYVPFQGVVDPDSTCTF
jgi:hypothetical protein